MLKQSQNIFQHLFVFVSANVKERQKEIERNYSALHEKVTDGYRERKREREKKKNSSKVIPQTHNCGPLTVLLYFHVTVIQVVCSSFWTERAYSPSSSSWVKKNTEVFPCVFFENWKSKVHPYNKKCSKQMLKKNTTKNQWRNGLRGK